MHRPMAAIAMAFISLVVPMDDEATYYSSDRIYHVVQLGLRRRAGERPSFSHRCHYTHVSLSLAPPYDIAPSHVERALTIIIEKVFSIINTVSCAITWIMIF